MRSPDFVVEQVPSDLPTTSSRRCDHPTSRAGRRSGSGRRPGQDRGFTLIETTLAIILMGTVILVIINAIVGVIRVSSVSDDAARVEAALTSAADRLAGWTYLSCPEENDQGYDAIVAAAAADVGWTHANSIVISEILYWDPLLQPDLPGVDENAADGGWNTSNTLGGTDSCGEDVNFTTSRTLQRITIIASSPDGEIVRELEVVKSNVGDRIQDAP